VERRCLGFRLLREKREGRGAILGGFGVGGGGGGERKDSKNR